MGQGRFLSAQFSTGIGAVAYLAALATLLCAGHLLLGLSLLSAGALLLFAAFYVFLPGRALSRLLGRVRTPDSFDDVESFFLGFLLLVVQYYPLTWLGLRALLPYLSPAFALVVALVARRRGLRWRRVLAEAVPRPDAASLAVAAAAMAFSSLVTLFRYPRPDVFSGVQMYPDMAWHIGNVNLLSGANGFADPRVHGATFTYHYFSDLFYALERLVFGTPAFDLVVQLQFLIVGPLLSAAALAFFLRTLGGRRLPAVGATVVLLFLPAVLPGYGNPLSFHLLSDINAMGFALPLLLLLLATAARLAEDPADRRSAILAPALLMLLAGTKGPAALVYVAALVAFTAFLVLKRAASRTWIVSALASVAAYAVVHATLLSGGAGQLTFGLDSPNGIVVRVPAYEVLFSAVRNDTLLTVLLLPSHFLMVASPLAVPFLVASGRLAEDAVRRERRPDAGTLLLLVAAAGAVAYYLVGHAGLSQMYFLFAAIPAVVALGAQETLRLRDRSQFLWVRAAVALILAASLVVSGIAAYRAYRRHAADIVRAYGEDRTPATVNKVSAAEYEALLWIRENLPEDALFATNRHGRDGRFFLYSAYSERRFYVEGQDYAGNLGFTKDRTVAMVAVNDRLFVADESDRHGLAVRLGIRYVALFKHEWLRDPPQDGTGFTLLFENEDLAVYRVD